MKIKNGCTVCNNPRFKKVEIKAWELIDRHKPTINRPGSYEHLVKCASIELGIELNEEEINAIAYHVASGG